MDDAICESVTCDGDGECWVADSFPSQIFCSGNCTGPNCDDPVQDAEAGAPSPRR